MMRKIVGLIIAVLFVASTIPSLASAKEKSIFQLMADSMSKPVKLSEKNRIKPVGKIEIFQNLADGIREGSAKVKNCSLRKK